MPLIANASKVYFVLESRENSTQVVLSLEQAHFDAQIQRLKECKMWDAIEQYSEWLADEGEILQADLREIRRLRFLQHF